MKNFIENFAKVAEIDPEAWDTYMKALARVTEIALAAGSDAELENGKKVAMLLLKQCYNTELMDWDEYSVRRKYVDQSTAGGYMLVRLVYEGVMTKRGRSAAEVNSAIGISGTLRDWYEANK